MGLRNTITIICWAIQNALAKCFFISLEAVPCHRLQGVLTRRDQLKRKQEQKEEREKAAGHGHVDDDEKDDQKAKGKSKARGKAKAEGKRRAKGSNKGKQNEEHDEQPEKKNEMASTETKEDEPDEIPTPKRKLFDDGESASGSDATHDPKLDETTLQQTKFIDPKTGKEKNLREVFEEYLPNEWRKRMRLSGDAYVGLPPSGTSSTDPAQPKPTGKGKAKAKAKGKAKTQPKKKAVIATPEKGKSGGGSPVKSLTSPAIKKEQARRAKKKQQAAPEEADMSDPIMQGIFHQRIKDVQNFSVEELKAYIKDDRFAGVFKKAKFSWYWRTTSVGVLTPNRDHIVSLSTGDKITCWNEKMALSCAGAYVLVSWHQFVGGLPVQLGITGMVILPNLMISSYNNKI